MHVDHHSVGVTTIVCVCVMFGIVSLGLCASLVGFLAAYVGWFPGCLWLLLLCGVQYHGPVSDVSSCGCGIVYLRSSP